MTLPPEPPSSQGELHPVDGRGPRGAGLDSCSLDSAVVRSAAAGLDGGGINLYALEHRILRREFPDARIHAAINCASGSCPTLQPRAFRPESLDAQLDATPVALADALLSTTHDLAGVEQWNVAADAQAIAQLLTALDGLGDTTLAISDETLSLSSVQPASDYDLHSTPVETLFSSLTAHSATSVQALAEVQVQLMRQGGSISFEDGRTVARVPLARKP